MRDGNQTPDFRLTYARRKSDPQFPSRIYETEIRGKYEFFFKFAAFPKKSPMSGSHMRDGNRTPNFRLTYVRRKSDP